MSARRPFPGVQRPFLIVDWAHRFTFSLRDLLFDAPPDAPGDTASCTLVFPHRRPIRYLREVLALDPGVKKPLLLPRMESVTPWMSSLRAQLEGMSGGRPLRQAGLLDRAALLFDVVQGLGDGYGPLAALPMERDRFFPWGMRLAELMEELLRHCREPANLEHVAGEVQEEAAALLGRLGDIYGAYVSALDERGWTTPGLDASRVAARAEEAAELLAGQRVILAGFHALTGAEEALFRALWNQGAEVVLHTDPALAQGHEPHFACDEHSRWLRRWKARAVAYGPVCDDPPRTIRFVEGFDLHSQLAVMAEALGPGPHTDAAVIVPDSDALMPVLHHLPEADVNVSMGYPLSRTALYRLLDTIVGLQERARAGDDGRPRWYWRSLVELIRHPYLKLMEYAPGLPLRPALRALEQEVRRQGTYQRPDPASLSDAAFPGSEPQTGRELLARVLDACLDGFARADTLRGLGDAVLDLCALLLPDDDDGGGTDGSGAATVWSRFPLDAECLHRLLTSVVPTLRESAMSLDAYGPKVLFAVLRLLLARERVPFEADPLTGLQVMGMLESRLLRFEHLVILGATDDVLPGGPSHDPLLPDPLRLTLGLPDQGQRARVAAYNFFGLLQGPGEAVICWHAGVQGTGPGASKGVRSRFVEQLIWAEEQRVKRLLAPGEPPLSTVAFPVRPMPERVGTIAVTEPVREKLSQILGKVSATLLDTWLACPVRFFHRYLTPLQEVEDVAEQGDPRELGILVHEALQDFFAPRLGQAVDPSALDPGPLMDAFSGRLHTARFFRQMHWDRRLAVESAGRERLRRFLANQPPTTVMALEKGMGRDMVLPLDPSSSPRRLTGYADRVDRREEGIVVLDYKTGICTGPGKGFWDREDLWANLAAWEPGDAGADAALLDELAKRLGSVQLPLYMCLYEHQGEGGERPANAALVELKQDGKELPLFDTKMEPGRVRHIMDEQVPLLLGFLVGTMATAEVFTPRPGKLCEWCPYGGQCPSPD